MGIIETIMEFRREEGFEEGTKRTSERAVINLLEKLGLSDEKPQILLMYRLIL